MSVIQEARKQAHIRETDKRFGLDRKRGLEWLETERAQQLYIADQSRNKVVIADATERAEALAMAIEEYKAETEKKEQAMSTLSNEPTAIEIIARSIAMHPSLFADAIKTRYYEDREYAARRKDETATHRSVMASAESAAKALCMAADEDAEAFKGNMAAGIIALNIACKLQCLPAHVRTAAALRTWPEA